MLLKLLKTILTKINIMKPDSSTIQKASGNINSSITQVTVTNNAMTEQQMTDLCLRLIDEKLQPLREDARNTLRLLISEFSCELFERIGKLEGNIELLNSFAKPSVELALGESLMGYSQRPSDRHKRLLIETMIESLKVDDVSTKAILLDRIRLGIPQLTINQIDMIAIMVFTDLMVSCDTIEELKDYFRQLNPIVENASALTSVDFLYLQHTEFFHRISFAGRMDIIGDKLSRTYKTFFEFIYQIGGLLKVFVFIGGLLVIGINLSLMNVSISNLMYNMIHPNNEKDVLLPYKECEKQEEDKGLIAPIFLSLNPILKQLSYEYYRFERSRGMEFDVKEALSKLFLCCCNVKTIKQKDKIFAESGREIEKVLDTRTVVTFAQQCRKMKYLILNNNAVMLGYMKQQNISYDTLYLIRQDLLHQQIMTSASPMSITYYKQNFFINALITMRNQGDLSRKDILIFKVMGLNKKLLQKFFISYSDRLSLIYPKNDKDNQDVINTQTGLI